jgi:hypothetical protein
MLPCRKFRHEENQFTKGLVVTLLIRGKPYTLINILSHNTEKSIVYTAFSNNGFCKGNVVPIIDISLILRGIRW